MSDVHSILQGAMENGFRLVVQKESYEIASGLKTFKGKKSALIGKVDFRELAKMFICRMYTIDLR